MINFPYIFYLKFEIWNLKNFIFFILINLLRQIVIKLLKYFFYNELQKSPAIANSS